jgi:hypothetical protein
MQIEKDLAKYPIFSQCRFQLAEEKGLLVHCPGILVTEIYRYRHIVLAAAVAHEISGFVIFLVEGKRYCGVKITLENLWGLQRFALEILYRRGENYFRK